MLEILKKVIPSYFVEKFEETDQRQIDRLPDSVRRALIHGTPDEFIQVVKDLRVRERLQRKTFLGEAAMELLRDMRFYTQGE